MSNKKQTAIEFLVEKINKFNTEFSLAFKEEIEQAKEIEKRHIIDAYIDGKYESDLVVMSDKYYAEQYYKETFNT